MSESDGSPEGTMRCSGCSYDLRGLPENRCPECGRPFDPGSPDTYVAKLRSSWPYLAAALFGLVALALPRAIISLGSLRRLFLLPASVRLAHMETGRIIIILTCVIVSLAGLVTELYVLRATTLTLSTEPGAVQHRAAFVAACAISWATAFGTLLYLILELVAGYYPSPPGIWVP